MKNIKDFLVPTVVLFAICLVASLLLAVTNNVTAPKIEENAVIAQQEAMKAVMPGAASFDKEIENEFGTCAGAFDKDGNVIGYAVTSIGKGGYGGEIKLMVGIGTDGKVKATSVLEESETASIGGKLKTNGFLEKFIGLSGSAALTKNGGTVDAVSGATKTSTGMTDAVNNALQCCAQINKGVSANG